MRSWTYSTESTPSEQRCSGWRSAMGRLNLPIGAVDVDHNLCGTVSCLTSPLGIEFARVRASPQEISGDYPKQPNAIWLSLLVEGRSTLIDGERRINLLPGDLLYGPTGAQARLLFTTDFCQLFVKVPHVALSPRLLAPLSLPLGYMPCQGGINRVFSQMLAAVADTIDDLTVEQLRPIELSFTEFLLTCLTGQSATPLVGCGANARASNLHSICQTIEANLADPMLNPVKVASEHGVSLRYLQKLFAQSGNTFSNFVRLRRLERCRADLCSPVYANMSVTEICFRWGFNGSAHFSRAFRSQYGVPPRDFRKSSLSTELAGPDYSQG